MNRNLKSIFFGLIQFILFWLVSFAVLLKLMDQDGNLTTIDFIYTGLFHIHLIIFVSLNTFLFIPRDLEKGKYWIYGLEIMMFFLSSFVLYEMNYNWLSDWMFPDFYFVAVYEPHETLGILLIYYVVSTLLVLSKSWFKALSLQKEVAELKELTSANELKSLRSQVSPHFLFNSLNTIYGLSIKKAPETPESILSLSQILRYNLEQSTEELASLRNEVDYVKDYINLQKARLDFPDQLRLVVLGEITNQKVPTLMIIEFLENALKHGNIQSEGAFVYMKITIDNDVMEMVCSNSIDIEREHKLGSTGIGLNNIRKRLELLFPSNHNLVVNKKNHEFIVELRLNYV